MYKLIFILLSSLLFLTGCGDDNKVRVIADLDKATVFVNGKKMSEIRIGYATLMLPSGEHTIKVEKLSKDGEWLYNASKTVKTNSAKINYVEFEIINQNETQKRKDRIAKEEREAKELAQRVARELAEKKKMLWESSEFVEDKTFDILWQNTFPKEKMTQSNAKTYCKNLGFAKKNEWRLPTISEVLSINNQSKLKYTGSLLTLDVRKSGGYYYPKYVNKYHVDHGYDNSKYNFLCVKDKDNKENNKLVIAKKFGLKAYPSRLFLDEKNKLLWENDNYFGHWIPIYKAVTYCGNLNIDGIKKWRLPTKNELVYLHTQKPKYANQSYQTFYTSTKANKNYNYVVTSEGKAKSAESFLSYHYRCVKDYKVK